MAFSFVDAHAATAAAATVTVTAPDGIQNGDILIASAHARKSSQVPTITLPAGFTEIANSSHGSTNHHEIVGWKRAASESGNYQLAGSGATTMEATVSVFRGCLASGDPVDVSSNTTYVTSNAQVRGASITTNYTDIIVFCGFANRSAATAVLTPETGYTEAAEVEQLSSTYFCVEHSYKLDVAPGATGNIDADCGGSIATKHAFLVALRPAATLTVCPLNLCRTRFINKGVML
jgi:hypothetical protein